MKSTIVHTKSAAAARAAISLRHLNALIAAGEGPVILSLGKRRVGIADDDLSRWLRSRRRRPAPTRPQPEAA